MSWMGAWPPEWEQSANGEEATDRPVPMFAKWLKPKKMIGISNRYKDLEPEDEEEEEADRNSCFHPETDSDGEPGIMFRPADPGSRADRVCPCGGVRNWFQRNCDCGMAIYWPLEDGEDLEGLHRCQGYRDQKKRWKRAKRNGMKKMPEAQEEEEEEESETEEMASAG